MHADYKCECEHTMMISYSIKDGPPKQVACPKCTKNMQRVWQAAIHIPLDFADDLTTSISNRMAHGARPTGRSKSLY